MNFTCCIGLYSYRPISPYIVRYKEVQYRAILDHFYYFGFFLTYRVWAQLSWRNPGSFFPQFGEFNPNLLGIQFSTNRVWDWAFCFAFAWLKICYYLTWNFLKAWFGAYFWKLRALRDVSCCIVILCYY